MLVQYDCPTAADAGDPAMSAHMIPSPHLRAGRQWHVDVTAGNTGSQRPPSEPAGTVSGVGRWTEATASLGNDDALGRCLQLSLGMHWGRIAVMCILHPAAAASSCAGGGLQSTHDGSSISQRAASNADMTMTLEGTANRARLLTSCNVKTHCGQLTQRWTVLRSGSRCNGSMRLTQLVC